MSGKTALKLGSLGLLTLALAVTAYYAWAVARAREHTRRVVAPLAEPGRLPLKAADLSPRRLEILLKVQDPAFFEHHGVDLGTPGAGLTTITQSLVKFYYFDHFQPGISKIEQTLIAYFALDPLVSKQDQLTLFINTVGLGQGARGFAQASRHYFGKEFGDISEGQYLSLAAMIVAPKTFNLRTHPERNAERVRRIKLLVGGNYTPKGVCDQYYGPLPPAVQAELPPASYFESYYR